MNDQTISTPETCLKELEPVLNQVSVLIIGAPLPPEKIMQLSMLVAGHMVGVAAACTGLPFKDGMHAICEAILASVDTVPPRKLHS